MNRLFKRFLGMTLALTLALSLFCVNAMAAAPAYPHLSVGAATVTTLKAGDTVRIPVSLAGLGKDAKGNDQYLSGISCNVAAMNDGYLTVETVEFASSINGWSGGYNKDHQSVNKVNLAFAEHPEDSLYSNGLLFTVVCKVAKDIPAGTNTGIQLSNISMSQTSKLFLNSTDGTEAGLDRNAVAYPVDADGKPTGGVTVPKKTTYTMMVAADKTEAVLGEIVTVTVKVNGGVFNGAAYDLTYDPALFELVTKPAGATDKSGTCKDLYTNKAGAADGTAIATYTFKTLAQDTETTGYFTLTADKAFVENYASSTAGNSVPCQVSAPAAVKITLKDDLTVSADNVKVFFDNKPHSVTATANKTGAVIRYADADGKYTLSASPAYTAVGEYTVKFCATLKGYETAYGEAKITINQPQYFTESTEYVPGYSLVLVYTNYNTTRYTYDGNVMLNVKDAGYSLEGYAYDYVYAWVVKGDADPSKIGYTSAEVAKVAYSCDVNASGQVDLRDIVFTMGVYNADPTSMTSEMDKILRADVNHSKNVNSDDYSLVLAEYKK